METENPEAPQGPENTRHSKTARCRLTIPQILEQIAIGFSAVRPLFMLLSAWLLRLQMVGAMAGALHRIPFSPSASNDENCSLLPGKGGHTPGVL